MRRPGDLGDCCPKPSLPPPEAYSPNPTGALGKPPASAPPPRREPAALACRGEGPPWFPYAALWGVGLPTGSVGEGPACACPARGVVRRPIMRSKAPRGRPSSGSMERTTHTFEDRVGAFFVQRPRYVTAQIDDITGTEFEWRQPSSEAATTTIIAAKRDGSNGASQLSKYYSDLILRVTPADLGGLTRHGRREIRGAAGIPRRQIRLRQIRVG